MSAAAALDGILVIDASEGVAGGYCTKLLAGLGAEVLKVERPGTGDPLRRAGPFPRDVPHCETSGAHLHLATGKRSVTLDISTRTGEALLLRLLERADVFVMGAPPASRLAPGALAARFPRLVVTTVTPHGLGGPRFAWRSTEIIDFALSGYLSLNGDPDREPLKVYGAQAQLQAGLHAALGTLAALHARDGGSASPPMVDASSVEAAGFLLAGALQRYAAMGRPQMRNGPRPAGFGPNRLYPSTIRPCRGGHVHVHCHNRFHELISVLMQEPELAAPQIMHEPLGHADRIDALMDRWLATRSKWDAVAEAQELRIPMTEVLDPGEVMADRLGQHGARGFFAVVAHPVAGELTQPGAPLRMHGTPWRPRRAPLLGEHNVAVYCDELGLSARELAALAAAGVV